MRPYPAAVRAVKDLDQPGRLRQLRRHRGQSWWIGAPARHRLPRAHGRGVVDGHSAWVGLRRARPLHQGNRGRARRVPGPGADRQTGGRPHVPRGRQEESRGVEGTRGRCHLGCRPVADAHTAPLPRATVAIQQEPRMHVRTPRSQRGMRLAAAASRSAHGTGRIVCGHLPALPVSPGRPGHPSGKQPLHGATPRPRGNAAGFADTSDCGRLDSVEPASRQPVAAGLGRRRDADGDLRRLGALSIGA